MSLEQSVSGSGEPNKLSKTYKSVDTSNRLINMRKRFYNFNTLTSLATREQLALLGQSGEKTLPKAMMENVQEWNNAQRAKQHERNRHDTSRSPNKILEISQQAIDNPKKVLNTLEQTTRDRIESIKTSQRQILDSTTPKGPLQPYETSLAERIYQSAYQNAVVQHHLETSAATNLEELRTKSESEELMKAHELYELYKDILSSKTSREDDDQASSASAIGPKAADLAELDSQASGKPEDKKHEKHEKHEKHAPHPLEKDEFDHINLNRGSIYLGSLGGTLYRGDSIESALEIVKAQNELLRDLNKQRWEEIQKHFDAPKQLSTDMQKLFTRYAKDIASVTSEFELSKKELLSDIEELENISQDSKQCKQRMNEIDKKFNDACNTYLKEKQLLDESLNKSIEWHNERENGSQDTKLSPEEKKILQAKGINISAEAIEFLKSRGISVSPNTTNFLKALARYFP